MTTVVKLTTCSCSVHVHVPHPLTVPYDDIYSIWYLSSIVWHSISVIWHQSSVLFWHLPRAKSMLRPPPHLTFQYFWFHSISWSRFPRSWPRNPGSIFYSWESGESWSWESGGLILRIMRILILRIWISQWYHSLLTPASITVDSGSTWKCQNLNGEQDNWRKTSFYKAD